MAEPRPVYNYDDFIATNINKFQVIHSRVRDHMKTYREELQTQQHNVAKKVTFNIGNLVMAKLHVPVASSNKLSPKFTGPHRIIDTAGGNKYRIQNLGTLEVTIRHADDLKKVNMEVDLTVFQPDIESEEKHAETETEQEDNDLIDDTDESHEYIKKLTRHTQTFRQSDSDNVLLICNITEFFLQNEFHNYVNELLRDLEVDVNSFYR